MTTRSFGKKIKSFFSNKGLETNNIILYKKKSVTDSSTLSNLVNNYFINITSTLKSKQSSKKFLSVLNLLINYKDNMSIKKVKETYKIAETFCFKEQPFKEVKKLLKL